MSVILTPPQPSCASTKWQGMLLSVRNPGWTYSPSLVTVIPYKRKFSRESNFRYFRERFENAKICLRKKLYLKSKFKSWYRFDILLHTLSKSEIRM